MSPQPRLQPTRRTVLRSAAWSTAAVTVVIATPNIAAASPGTVVVPRATMTTSAPEKYSVQNTKFVAWDMVVQAGDMDLSGLTMLFTYTQNGGGTTTTLDDVVVRGYSPAVAWAAAVTQPTITPLLTAKATATTASKVLKGATANIHVQFQGSDNSSGQVGAILMANDSAGRPTVIGTAPLVWWGTGKEHGH